MNPRAVPTEGEVLSLEEFERLPEEEGKGELVRGRVVREPPAGMEHGRIAARLAALLQRFVREKKLGEIFGAETGFVLDEDPPTVRAPDVAFVARGRLPEGDLPTGFGRLAPDLTVEIVSPSNTAAEIRAKVLDYLDAGTRAVWVVDPATRTVEVCRSREEIRILREADDLEGGDVLPGFRIEVSELFVR